jgi:hypothetical protein
LVAVLEEVLVAVLEEDEGEDEGLSLLPSQEAKITKTTAPIPRPIFIPRDMPVFAGWPMPGAGGPNGA